MSGAFRTIAVEISQYGWAARRSLTARGARLYVPGPSPRRSGAVAQLVERLVRNEEVSGSIPLGSTIQSGA